MTNKSIVAAASIICLAAILCLANSTDDNAGLATKCAAVFGRVTTCLAYVTAKAPTPTRECCGTVTDLRGSDPACLCFIIQQVHNGSNAAIKSMGVQESRLLQLPSACHVVNASVAECPRLLHLAPNSSDAAIFTNASAATTTPTPTTTGSSSSPSTASSSQGFWCEPHFGVSAIVAAIAIVFVASPLGFQPNLML